MKEALLQYIWKFKKFRLFNLVTTDNKKIDILNFGIHNPDSGPDFLMGKILIDHLEWNGNIEIHVKSSDFEKHNHQKNISYQNIILHVVYEHDKDIPILLEKNIPTLELKSKIHENIITNYHTLEAQNHNFIPCEKLLTPTCNPILSEKLYWDKLQCKSEKIYKLLTLYKNDWERTSASIIAYNFGLKLNAEAFEQIFQSIEYRIIKKISSKQILLEALFFGLTGQLKDFDEYSRLLKKEFLYLQAKFNIPHQLINLKFSKLRPANFPTIRLSQLASLFSQYQNLFSYIVGAKDINQYFKLLEDVCASKYWTNHYVFGKKSSQCVTKKLSKSQKELIIINSFLPIKFTYSLSIGKSMEEDIINIINELPPEKNSIISNYKNLGIKFKSSLDTQAYLHLYKNKCLNKQCLHCELGYDLLSTKIL